MKCCDSQVKQHCKSKKKKTTKQPKKQNRAAFFLEIDISLWPEQESPKLQFEVITHGVDTRPRTFSQLGLQTAVIKVLLGTV